MSKLSSVRVRIAPSPTGMPHVGLFHTFLVNWLYARHSGGQFVVRIEDTDVARRVDGAVEALLEAIRWLGLDWDEGPLVGGPFAPYVQSERLERYATHARQLVAAGRAYYCYCSQERLTELREDQERRRVPPGYDRRCRELRRRNAPWRPPPALRRWFGLPCPSRAKLRSTTSCAGTSPGRTACWTT